jgi:hypothetical protein
MYRDTAAALDEHDRAVGAILIGEALIDACELSAARIRHAETSPEPARWRAVTDVHDTYPEIWRHLDRARRLLAARGANTAAYDDLRPHARRAATIVGDAQSVGVDRAPVLDTAVLDDAKRAIGELKLAVPGADWDAIAARTSGLVAAPLGHHRRHRLAIAGVVAAFMFAIVTWFLAIVPERKPDRGDAMRRELIEIQYNRKLRIDELAQAIGERCTPNEAHELMKLLVLDGRGPDAKAFAAGYLARCGADPVVEHWARAPRPPAR